MAFAVKRDESAHLINIRLFDADAVVFEADFGPDLVEKARFRARSSREVFSISVLDVFCQETTNIFRWLRERKPITRHSRRIFLRQF